MNPNPAPDTLQGEKKMNKIEEIEGAVKELSAEELSAFRAWFSKFDADAWDRQFEADVKAGKLDALAERALFHHTSGAQRPAPTRPTKPPQTPPPASRTTAPKTPAQRDKTSSSSGE